MQCEEASPVPVKYHLYIGSLFIHGRCQGWVSLEWWTEEVMNVCMLQNDNSSRNLHKTKMKLHLHCTL